MPQKISVTDVYDQNLNFLIGAGASFGLLPTLGLAIRRADGSSFSVETLATQLEDDPRRSLLLMHYYLTCILPAQQLDYLAALADPQKAGVLTNYRLFLETVLRILQRRRSGFRSCNIFTTNYDGCFQHAAEELLQLGHIDFVVNDGTRGFRQKILNVRNFSSHVYDVGLLQRHKTSIPQINLMHLHGSVYWERRGSNIVVDYSPKERDRLVDKGTEAALSEFSNTLLDAAATIDLLLDVPEVSPGVRSEFDVKFGQLPIVNPTKWKFNTTLFDENYYHLLRMLSYELEKPASVLISFGFSFADEHILSLVKRSLSNPTLQVFVCCHTATELDRLSGEFKQFSNVVLVGPGDVEELDFSFFNEEVFKISNFEGESAAEQSGAN